MIYLILKIKCLTQLAGNRPPNGSIYFGREINIAPKNGSIKGSKKATYTFCQDYFTATYTI